MQLINSLTKNRLNMSVLNLTVKKFYTSIAILGCVVQTSTACATSIRNPASPYGGQTNITITTKPNIAKDKQPQSPALILDTKTIFGENSHPPMEGPRTGGGGNSCALAITQNTTTLMELLSESMYQSIFPGSDSSKVISTMKKTRFYLKEALIKDGQAKDAMNYPFDGVIYVSPKFCASELVEVSGRSMSLLLHEYLGLAGINDRNYEVSGKFLEIYVNGKSKDAQTKVWLKNEFKKDLRGKKSCFGGAIAKSIAEYEGDDRNFLKDREYTINIMPIDYSGTGITDGQCKTLDKNKREIDYTSANAVYWLCSKSNYQTYLATVPLLWGSHGSVGISPVNFKVTRIETTTTFKRYGAEVGEGVLNESSQTKIECAPHDLKWEKVQ
ncbi:hypothetical protein ACLSU7_17010 [Bdellovibrio sp. HCB185ZH]|uniref:hypothetical protein n=1 Tax=Bdellovibrio sp. HCB185ZH TaxID=3394235 RepID=UPI0039A5E0A8